MTIMSYLACFDVSDDKARYRVARALDQYGTRVQRSVFEISLSTPIELQKLKRDLRSHIDGNDDVRFYSLCKNCRQKSHDLEDNRVARFPSFVII